MYASITGFLQALLFTFFARSVDLDFIDSLRPPPLRGSFFCKPAECNKPNQTLHDLPWGNCLLLQTQDTPAFHTLFKSFDILLPIFTKR